MRILELARKPVHRLRYINAARRGGTESALLEVLRADVDALPEGVKGLIATSDLQGVVAPSRFAEPRLLGEHLPEEFATLATSGQFPNLASIGAVLAGDLYAAPTGDQRGATGDVRSVWSAFAGACSWVVGVAGNHDTFGSTEQARSFERQPRVHLLDCGSVVLGGTRFAGVGYVPGDPARVGRREEDDYQTALELVLEQRPDVLVLHSTPAGDDGQRGSSAIRELLLRFPPLLVICGHCHWDDPLHELPNGTQVLNVDARVVLLARR